MKIKIMKKYLLQLSLACCFSAATNLIWAQAPGSSEATGGTAGVSAMALNAGDVTASASETLYIGPGDYTINGTWEIYSKNVWISPAATFTGTGTMKYFNPSVAGGAASPTLIDGNNSTNFINVNIELDNASNLVLTDLAGPGAPWTDAAGLANLSTGADFKFNVANGDVLPGNFDLITATAATLTSFAADRFVVTAGTGHLVHNNYTGNFTYPVGIAEGDFTPAIINNTVVNTMHVLVQNYASSAADESALPSNAGMDRTWNIYGDNAAGNSSISLQHNGVGGSPGNTNQGAFNEASHFVTQWSAGAANNSGDLPSASAWQNNTLGSGAAGTVPGSNVRSHNYTAFGVSASDQLSFFTKSSTVIVVPVTLISFEGKSEKCSVQLSWQTSAEINFNYFEIQYSATGTSFRSVGRESGRHNVTGSSYNFSTAAQPEGKGYYRLAMVDLDGRVTYGPVTTVSTNCNTRTFTLSPNPATDLIAVSGLKAGETVQIYGINGELIVSKAAKGFREETNISRYASGIYTVIVVGESGKLIAGKFVKQ
jgi:hypothetical protein